MVNVMSHHSHSNGRIMDEQTAAQLRARFDSEMPRPVEILMFKGTGNEEYSVWTEQLLQELQELSDKLKIGIYDITLEPSLIEEFNITRTPTILIDPRSGYKIRYTGAPAGYEAWAFVETIILVSRGDSGLSARTREILEEAKRINKEAHIMVFVTPTCPYCPHQVLLTNKFAIELAGLVESDCIEAYENPDIADTFGVSAVPHNVIAVKEGGKEIPKDVSVGLQPEEKYASDLIKALRG